MENMEKGAKQQEPEWEPIEDTPPPRGLLENIIVPSFLPIGVLILFAAIVDILFSHFFSREDQMALVVGGVFGIWAWVMSKVMGN